MARHIALLRGINVGGKRIIKMEALRAMFVAAGAKDVATYIQSGNVVFTHARPSAAKLQKAILDATGFDVPVMLRTADELRALAHPFPDDDHVHVFFAAAPLAEVTIKAVAPERYVVTGRDIYGYFPAGVGNSKLAGALTKLPVTARNWRTVQALLAMVTAS